jgi:hypothetical protein
MAIELIERRRAYARIGQIQDETEAPTPIILLSGPEWLN